MNSKSRKRVVIIGAGFGGLWAVKYLSNTEYDVVLIDRNNYHTFLPLLYQVSAAEIEPEQIASPVRYIVRNNNNVRFIRGEVSEINYSARAVMCLGHDIHFDYLIIAPGSVNNDFGIPGVRAFSFSLKTLDDGMIVRNHILSCFERASFIHDDEQRKRLLTIAIVGGGPTGVEFAGALSELVSRPFQKDFPELDGNGVDIYLIEAADRLLGMYEKELSEYTKVQLLKKGVRVCCNSIVAKMDKKGVHLQDGTTIETETIVWTAGVKIELMKNDFQLQTVPNGRIIVDEYCRMKGYNDVFIVGDAACFEQNGRLLPMIAPVAIQQGRYTGTLLGNIQNGKRLQPFRYIDKGSMVAIGRSKAVTHIAGLSLKGFIAWLIWIFVHILYLIGFKNKLFVMINWIWSYIFFEKSVRLILPRCCDNPGSGICLRCGPGHSGRE